jgi:hypothetical protein
LRSWCLAALLLVAGCDAPCVEDIDLDCAPLYTDLSWTNVHATTIEPSCAAAGCHSSDAAAGDLVLTPAETAWEQLVESAPGSPPAVAGDASCSPMIIRLESESDSLLMPPGAQLSDAERCVLRLWVQQGAEP